MMTVGGFFRYTLLPGVLPRFRDLLSLGFAHSAYFVALLFEAVRLLPQGHPYLSFVYFGRFTMLQVIKEAWKRLYFSRKNLDQIFMFFTICLGMVLFVVQVTTFLFYMIFGIAWATTTTGATPLQDPPTLTDVMSPLFTLSDIIETKYPENDIAFMLMDRVFGIDDMFNSRYDPTGLSTGGFPYPYHFGLHTLFQTFSTALLAVGLLILTYFVTTIVAETMRDGTPFGKRMNRVWAPIRLVLAFGLLVPISSGLNAAQYMVLIAAKWGSGFATNGLTYYYGEIDDLGGTPFGPEASLIATPNAQDPSTLIQFMLTARACQFATQFAYDYDDGANAIKHPVQGYYIYDDGSPDPQSAPIAGFGQSDVGAISVSATALSYFQTVIAKTKYESVIIVFGHKDSTLFPDRIGNVEPYCGRLTMPVIAPENPMALDMQGYFLAILSAMWKDQQIIDAAAALAAKQLNKPPCNTTDYPVSSCSPIPDPVDMQDFKNAKTSAYKAHMRNMISTAITNNLTGALEWCGPTDDPYLLSYGWAGAAICFNKIANFNGAVTAAAAAVPLPSKWPLFMEYVLQKRMEVSASINPEERFNPSIPGKDKKPALDVFEGKSDMSKVELASYEAYREWVKSGQGTGAGGTPSLSGMGLKDVVNIIFGTEGVVNMSKPENRDVHPLALLSAAGRGLVESAIRNVGFAGAGITAGAVFSEIGALGALGASFMFTFATISMAAGFVLFYVVPLMPFMYFFFAVLGWVKGIFEAMVGVPLWALAHLRIDGDGIPGQAALTGYLLILEIFLRPILILFGLIASSLIFVALSKILNEMWMMVVKNVTGFDQQAAKTGGYTIADIRFWRSPIDEFFYTILYAIVMYMVALSCFKLVDLIPNYILRWMGHSVEAFGETLGDPAAQVSQKATVGFSATSSKVIGAAEQIGGAGSARQGYEAAKEKFEKENPP